MTSVLPDEPEAGLLEPGDVVMAVAGLTVNHEGRVQHPRFGRVPLTVLWNDDKGPGELLKLEVLHRGQPKLIELPLRRRDAARDRVPGGWSGEKPPFVEMGGLVFR
ncbi:MAG: hypothetical protein HY901_34620, partial [Deltaproteobacteria bacterium]|nr:hypothetical protein [Deltaproteobacteria bacterium]